MALAVAEEEVEVDLVVALVVMRKYLKRRKILVSFVMRSWCLRQLVNSTVDIHTTQLVSVSGSVSRTLVLPVVTTPYCMTTFRL
jgi:hypothetical protein